MKHGARHVMLKVAILLVAAVFLSNCASVEPTAKSTSENTTTIEEAQREDYMGPKARVAVTRFTDKSAKGGPTGEIGDGMAEMLANALFNTNRYIVLERQSIDDVLKEQDLGASGRVKKETAAKIGEIEGAELLIEGTITEFEPGSSGAGGGVGGASHGWGTVGSLFGGIKTSHVAMIVKVIDAKTGRRLASEQVEGKATDIGGMGSLGGYHLAGAFGAYSKTPMEKAIRVAIEETVKLIVAKTPAEYYRVSAPQKPKPAPAATAKAPEPAKPAPAAPPPPPASPPAQPQQQQSTTVASLPPARLTQVTVPKENLRAGPGTNYKIIGTANKGTSLAILEDQGKWLRVRLEDGKEVWIWKGSTSEAAKSAQPASASKPKSPM